MEKERKLITVYFIDAQNMSCKLMEIENNLETFYKLIISNILCKSSSE